MGDLNARSLFSTEENSGLATNLAFAMVAQGLGLASSFVMSLLVPKLLGLEDYGYWQLFLLYSSYSGLALLGVNDGIYLRLGGKRYGDLDYGALKAQLFAILVSQVVIGAVILGVLVGSSVTGDRLFVYCLVVVSGFLANILSCHSYIFQSTNLTRISSLATMMNKALFLACVAGAFAFGCTSFAPFVLAFVACQALALVYCLACARRLIAAKMEVGPSAIRACLVDIVAGMKVTVAYYADSFIVGFVRMVTDWRMGISAFGSVSLAFSLTNFAVSFIGQVAMVLFPILKRLDRENARGMFLRLRSILHAVMPFAYLLYVPGRAILELWLPEYERSFVFLALTLPLCLYSSKANFLFNTYCKMERDEGYLCAVNLGATALNAAFAACSVLVFSSVELASVGVVVSVVLRDLVFERHFSKAYGHPYIKAWLCELALAAVFMASSWSLGNWSVLPVALSLACYHALDASSSREVAGMAWAHLRHRNRLS